MGKNNQTKFLHFRDSTFTKPVDMKLSVEANLWSPPGFMEASSTGQTSTKWKITNYDAIQSLDYICMHF